MTRQEFVQRMGNSFLVYAVSNGLITVVTMLVDSIMDMVWLPPLGPRLVVVQWQQPEVVRQTLIVNALMYRSGKPRNYIV